MAVNDFDHLYKKGQNEFGTLLMLHGTGGNENDMAKIAEILMPQYGVLSPRGKALEYGMPRFFRRFNEGDIDILDLIHRTHELADWIKDCISYYEIDPDLLTAVGYSNGANIASGLLLLRPEVVHSGILYHPMFTFEPEDIPNLRGKRIYIGGGQFDDIISPESTAKLSIMLKSYEADVTVRWFESGHNLSVAEIDDSREWLTNTFQI